MLIFNIINVYSQKKLYENIKYENIEKKIEDSHNNLKEQWAYIDLYIKKSKFEKNYETLVYAYRYASNFSKYPTNIKYADSAVSIGIKSKKSELITNAYINRGLIYMDEVFYEKALNDILLANKYSNKNNDEYTNNKTKYIIAQNKIYLGQYGDANEELESCLNYFKSNLEKKILGKDYEKYYIFSLMSYIDTNTRIGRQDKNKKLLKEAYTYLKDNDLKIFVPYFISSEGTDAYFSNNYQEAIKKLSEAIRLYNDPWPHNSEIFYIGLSYWKLGKRGVAIKYLEEIDKEYVKSKKLNPEFRSAYEILIKYSDSIGNKDKQLEYINKLMTLDRLYEKNYKYLYTKINKEYDTQKLINEKNKIESSLKTQRTIISSILILTLLTSLFFWYRYYNLQKKYKEKFEQIIAEKPKIIEIPVNKISKSTKKLSITVPKNSKELEFYNKIQGLNPIFVQNILQQLEVFENENKFTDNQISIRLLSEELDTNIPYLSKIINVYKGKNFNQYINDLRIDYIIDILKSDATFLNYDIKDLATMGGFMSAINFSDNFQRKYEIKPSYFIKMMKENIKNHHQS